MGKSCVYCTMWADGLRGYSELISDRMPWALTSPDDVETMKEFTEPRNWNYNVLRAWSHVEIWTWDRNTEENQKK